MPAHSSLPLAKATGGPSQAETERVKERDEQHLPRFLSSLEGNIYIYSSLLVQLWRTLPTWRLFCQQFLSSSWKMTDCLKKD